MFRRAACTLSFVLAACLAASAQTPAPAPTAPPPPPFSGSVGAGVSLTRGNSDTTNVNLSFDVKYDPKAKWLFKAEGLYLRAWTEGEETANRLSLQGRGERSLTARAFAFAQLQYLRDTFKAIDYLVAPTLGVGYKLVDTAATQFAVDTSLGAVWEKNPDADVKTSPAWTAGEKLSHKLSGSATVTESAQALWKLDDMADSLYTFSVALATSITSKSQLKVELLDTYKNRPPAEAQSNDVALLLSFVLKY